MNRKLKHVMAGTLLSACMGITYAGEAPRILGSIEYQALSRQEMRQVVGQGGGSVSGGGIESWRTNQPISVNGAKLGVGADIEA